LLITVLVTDSIKRFVGAPRPNTFALCNYQGYNDGNDIDHKWYYGNTTYGALGSYTNCWSTDKYDMQNAFWSFPSGHSSMIFSSMVWVALTCKLVYMCNKQDSSESVRLWNNVTNSLLASAAVILATWVSLTRITDMWHHYWDVIVGVMIGSCISYYAFEYMFLPRAVQYRLIRVDYCDYNRLFSDEGAEGEDQQQQHSPKCPNPSRQTLHAPLVNKTLAEL